MNAERLAKAAAWEWEKQQAQENKVRAAGRAQSCRTAAAWMEAGGPR